EENPLGGALVRRQCEHVLPVEENLSVNDLIVSLAGEHMGERRFARAVGAHDGMHAPLLDREIEPIENFLADDLDVQIFDFQKRHSSDYPTLPSRLTEMSFCASTANSIGSCCSTSLTKPLTTSATASSSESPRCMQ